MNKREHLLTCLIEECAEIQKTATKALRFGLDDHAPDGPLNSESIAHEIADLLAIVEMLEDEKIIPVLRTPKAVQSKKDKVIKYMIYAMEERGTLDIVDNCID